MFIGQEPSLPVAVETMTMQVNEQEPWEGWLIGDLRGGGDRHLGYVVRFKSFCFIYCRMG